MGLVGTFVVFVIVWWLVFFMTLPFGVHPPDEPEPGHAPSAPENPRLWIKAAITTAIAVTITGAAAIAVEYDLIGFREYMQDQ